MNRRNIVRPDSKGRVTLGRFGVKAGDRFIATAHEDGRIFLIPVTEGIFHDYDGYEPGSLDTIVQKRLSGEISLEEFDTLLKDLAKTEEPKEDGEVYGYR